MNNDVRFSVFHLRASPSAYTSRVFGFLLSWSGFWRGVKVSFSEFPGHVLCNCVCVSRMDYGIIREGAGFGKSPVARLVLVPFQIGGKGEGQQELPASHTKPTRGNTLRIRIVGWSQSGELFFSLSFLATSPLAATLILSSAFFLMSLMLLSLFLFISLRLIPCSTHGLFLLFSLAMLLHFPLIWCTRNGHGSFDDEHRRGVVRLDVSREAAESI